MTEMPDWTTNAQYLGDAVYAGFDGYHVVLGTSNGMEMTNIIYLEPRVVKCLQDYVQALREYHLKKMQKEMESGEEVREEPDGRDAEGDNEPPAS